MKTNQCSSHGECVSKNFPVKDTWFCKCSATKKKNEKGGVAKTYWAGNACQKVDISVQFHIIFIFAILMAGTIAAAIMAMMRMGDEELPGVLTAGMVSQKKQ